VEDGLVILSHILNIMKKSNRRRLIS